MTVSKIPRQSVDILRLGSVLVLDENGERVMVKSFWKDGGTVMITFVRHFACIACRAHVSQVLSLKEKFKESDVRLIFIGNGQPDVIKGFKENLNIPEAEIYTDPGLESYKACSFKKGFQHLVNLKTIKNAVQLFKKGHRQTSYDRSKGIHTQMGGIVVVQPIEKVVYHFISEALGDYPFEEEVLKEAKKREEIDKKPIFQELENKKDE